MGHFDLLIKSYPNGVMSKHFATLKPGDQLEFKARASPHSRPLQRMRPLQGPIMKLAWTPNKYKAVGMVAGGTGITPMLQARGGTRELLCSLRHP